MHARSDYAHAAAVERILRRHGVRPDQAVGANRSHLGGPLWGRAHAVAGGTKSLRAERPRSGGC